MHLAFLQETRCTQQKFNVMAVNALSLILFLLVLCWRQVPFSSLCIITSHYLPSPYFRLIGGEKVQRKFAFRALLRKTGEWGEGEGERDKACLFFLFLMQKMFVVNSCKMHFSLYRMPTAHILNGLTFLSPIFIYMVRISSSAK